MILELFVEPYAPFGTTIRSPRAETSAWNIYINGGEDPRGTEYIGVNAITRQIRAQGADNLVVVEPLGQNFVPYQRADGGYPYGQIVDTIPNELMYGIHPYFNFWWVGTTPREWDSGFGAFALTHPVVVSEWNQIAMKVGVQEKRCEPTPEGKGASLYTPLEFLHYVRDRRINGVVGWAFDMPGMMFNPAGQPTSMEGAVCDQVRGGIGTWLHAYFEGNLPPAPSSR